MKRLFEKGYAIPLYGLYTHNWRHFDEEVVLPHGSVSITQVDGIPCALWIDVQNAAGKKK